MRERFDRTYREIGEALGISTTHAHDICRGRRRPSRLLAKRIERIIGPFDLPPRVETATEQRLLVDMPTALRHDLQQLAIAADQSMSSLVVEAVEEMLAVGR